MALGITTLVAEDLHDDAWEPGYASFVSDDGRRVAYTGTVTMHGTSSRTPTMVADLDLGTHTEVSAPLDVEATGYASRAVGLTADGRTVLFESDTRNTLSPPLPTREMRRYAADLSAPGPPSPPDDSSLPVRVVDTRDGAGGYLGPVTAGSVVQIPPRAGAAAMVLNLTADAPEAAGYLTAWPCGTPVPPTSNLNYVAGKTVASLAVVGSGASGVCVSTYATAHLVVDLLATFPAISTYSAAQPSRLVDTRSSGGPPGPFAEVAAVVPPGVGGGVFTVTVTEPDAAGHLTVWPCGEARPHTSNLNYVAGQTVASAVVARPGADGRVCAALSTTGHVVIDLHGVFAATEHGLTAPARAVDTREAGARLEPFAEVSVPAASRAAVVNVTVTEPDAPGYVTAWPCGTPRPLASNLNFDRGETVANLVLIEPGPAGTVCLAASTRTHLVVDTGGSLEIVAASA